MPSSSTRSTHLEREITVHFKTAYLRLHHAGHFSEAKILSSAAQTTLDSDFAGLFATFDPKDNFEDPLPKRREKAEMRDHFNKLKHEGKTASKSNLVWDAGTKCMDIGGLLSSVGREAEGREWCEYGDALWGLAVEQMQAEEREKKRKRQYERWLRGGKWDDGSDGEMVY